MTQLVLLILRQMRISVNHLLKPFLGQLKLLLPNVFLVCNTLIKIFSSLMMVRFRDLPVMMNYYKQNAIYREISDVQQQGSGDFDAEGGSN